MEPSTTPESDIDTQALGGISKIITKTSKVCGRFLVA